MASKLYQFTLDCGRNGTLRGLFVRDESEIETIIGKDVYFGEVLGKHSEVQATMKAEMFEALTDDASFLSKFDEYGCASGYDPFDYLEGED